MTYRTMPTPLPDEVRAAKWRRLWEVLLRPRDDEATTTEKQEERGDQAA